MTRAPSDHELLDAVRSGDDSAYAELWSRHRLAAVRAAWQFDHSAEAEDIASEAFVRILAALRGGGGPVTAFRPYLFRTVSHLAQTSARRRRQVDLTAEDAAFDEPVPFGDPLLEGSERNYAVRAYRRLGRQHQAVVWYVDVEGLAHAEAARLLGTTPSAVRSMAARAREALRREFLQAHVDVRRARPECRRTLGQLGAHTRKVLAPTQRRMVEAHLDGCEHCRAVHRELLAVASSLRAALLPLVGGAVMFGGDGLVGDGHSGGTGSTADKAGSTAGSWAVVAAAVAAAAVFAAVLTGMYLLAPGDGASGPWQGPGLTDGSVLGPPVAPGSSRPVTPSPAPAETPGLDPPEASPGAPEPPTVAPPEARRASQPDDASPGAPRGDVAAPTEPEHPGSDLPGQRPPFTAPGTPRPEPPRSSAPPRVAPPVDPEEPEVPAEPEEPGEPGEPDEPAEPEEPEPDAAWDQLAGEAWSAEPFRHFLVSITGAEPGGPVEVSASSQAAVLVSPLAGGVPDEPPLPDDGVWECGERIWRVQQVCTATANEDGQVTAVFGVASLTAGAPVELDILVAGREPFSVTL